MHKDYCERCDQVHAGIDCPPRPVLSRHQMQQALQRIAEIDGPIECTSLHEWRDKVKAIANNALKGVK